MFSLVRREVYGVSYNEVKNNKVKTRRGKCSDIWRPPAPQKRKTRSVVGLCWVGKKRVRNRAPQTKERSSTWISRISKYCSGTALNHSTIYSQFSLYPKDMCEGEKIIEIQACLLMEGNEIFELAFFGNSIRGVLYWPGLKWVEEIDTIAILFMLVLNVKKEGVDLRGES